jgi:hypothetical protein
MVCRSNQRPRFVVLPGGQNSRHNFVSPRTQQSDDAATILFLKLLQNFPAPTENALELLARRQQLHPPPLPQPGQSRRASVPELIWSRRDHPCVRHPDTRRRTAGSFRSCSTYLCVLLHSAGFCCRVNIYPRWHQHSGCLVDDLDCKVYGPCFAFAAKNLNIEWYICGEDSVMFVLLNNFEQI